MEHEKTPSSDGCPTSACGDSSRLADCNDQGRRRTRNCRATLEGLLRVVKDEVEDRSVVVIVLSKESAMWREQNKKTLLHNAQLKYVDVGESRVVTTSKCIAAQTKNDRVEKVVTDGSKVVKDEVTNGRKSWKVVESNVMDGHKLRHMEKLLRTSRRMVKQLENVEKSWKTLRWMESELKKSCASQLRRRERQAMQAEMEGDNQDVVCVVDIIGKEWPWHAVRKAREQELKYLR